MKCLQVEVCLDDICCDSPATPTTLEVVTRLVTQSTAPICDPVTGAILIVGTVRTVLEGVTDNCICTCELPVNVMDSDPTQAIGQVGTWYEISVLRNGTRVFGPERIRLDGDITYGVGASCGGVPVCEALMDTPPSPPSDPFCQAVEACETPWAGTGTGIAITPGGVNGHAPGLAVLLDPASTAPASVSAAGLLINETTFAAVQGSGIAIAAGGTAGHTPTVSITIDPASTASVSVGPSGLLINDMTGTEICALVTASCPTTAVDNGNGTLTITGTNGAPVVFDSRRATVTGGTVGPWVVTDDSGATITIPAASTIAGCDDVKACIQIDGQPFPTAGLTLSGLAFNGTTLTGAPVGVSTDAGNILTAGVDTRPYLSCEVVQDCVGTAVAGVDGIIYNDVANSLSVVSADAGNILTVGTDGGLYLAVPVIAQEFFDPAAAATTVTVAFAPTSAHPMQVFRNGLSQRPVVDYTIAGTVITFTTAFGVSGGATGLETIEVVYSHA